MCERRVSAMVAVSVLGLLAAAAAAQDSRSGPRPVPKADLLWLPTEQDQQSTWEWVKRTDKAVEDMRARWKLLRAEYELAGRQLNESLARAMLDELWHDWGSPNVNAIAQSRALGSIGTYVYHATPEARAILRDGLVEYYQGGGAHDEYVAKDLARVFDHGGFLDDPEVQEIVAALGDPEGVLPDRKPLEAGADRKAARQLLRDLRMFLHTKKRDPAELQRIAARAARGFGSERIDEQVLQSLLTAYRQILLGTNPKADEAIVKIIDRDLIRIGRAAPVVARPAAKKRSVIKMRVSWARAVAAMQARASEALRKLVAKQAEAESNKTVIAALRRAGKAISRPAPPTPGTP